MKVEITGNKLKVERNGGKKIYSESTLLHHIKLALIERGFDMIKKRMWKDGHLVDDTQHYIRSRNLKKPGFAIWDTSYAIRFSYEPYNQDGEVALSVENWK